MPGQNEISAPENVVVKVKADEVVRKVKTREKAKDPKSVVGDQGRKAPSDLSRGPVDDELTRKELDVERERRS